MTKNLFIIAAASLVLSLACLGGAAALGGRALAENNWTWVITDTQDGPSDNVSFQRGDLGPEVTRNLEWTGGNSLTVDFSADVTYVQGDTPGVVITGPQKAADRVRLVDGRLTLRDSDDRAERVLIEFGPQGIRGWSESERLKITVTAPNVDSFRMAGSGDLTVERYDRPTISVMIDGSGDVKVDGKAGKLELRINGSGDAELEGLEVADANLDIAGSGDASVGPTGEAVVSIAGSGDVIFTRRPKNVQQNVNGSGDVSGL